MDDISKETVNGYVNGGTIERREAKTMDMDVIKRINNNMQILADAQKRAGIMYEPKEMKDWQWELMLRNETENEDWD